MSVGGLRERYLGSGGRSVGSGDDQIDQIVMCDCQWCEGKIAGVWWKECGVWE